MKNLFTFLLLFLSFSIFGQLDTMIVYDLATKTYEIFPPVQYDATITNDKTSSSIGTLDGFTVLSNEIPTENLFTDSDFTRLTKTADQFDLTHYPMRTSVKLKGISITGGDMECSGTLISENIVLTAAHCTFDYFGNIEFNVESMNVFPSYDEGEAPNDIPTAEVTKIFLTKKTIDGSTFFDVCMLLLDEPIGTELGYQGFGFAPTDELTEKVLHKMSYPAANSNTTPIEFYNGDTTYYNYGLISYDNLFGYLEIDSPDAEGIPGQSGSGLFESINEEHIIYGVLVSNNYQHVRLLPNYFYQMKNIVDNYQTVSSVEVFKNRTQVRVEPNPFDNGTTVKLFQNYSGTHQYRLISITGQILREGSFYNNELTLWRKDLISGIYVLSIVLENGETVMERIVVKEP